MIGVFDSGVGGLTVVKEIKKVMPEVPIIYFGDTARLPYGNNSQETIQKYSAEIVEFLKNRGCGTIVVACNSASALAADWLREKYPDFDIYDVVSSGAEAVVEASKKKIIGVIGTSATINSRVYNKKIAEFEPSADVFTKDCPLFVPLVEENWIARPETKKIARTYLRDMKLKKIDALLLGCTHYPLLEKVLRGVMGKRTKLVNSSEKLAKKLKEDLNKKNIQKNQSDKYFVSDLTPHFEKLAARILGKNVKIEKIQL
jgi:glutamate racemase